MAIPSDIVKYFAMPYPDWISPSSGQQQPKSLWQLVQDYGYHDRTDEILPVVQQLVVQGILIPAGRTSYSEGKPPWNERYFCPSYDPVKASYGEYDFAAYGFPEIYNKFKDAVKPVVVKKADHIGGKDEDIGTGFWLERGLFVTARHCIWNMREINIIGWNPSDAALSKIWVSSDKNIDLAILKFTKNPFPKVHGFKYKDAEILDSVLTMGYPQLPGFDNVLVTENAQISGHLKSTTGQIVTEAKAYWEKDQEYFLINARVKGGNSGCPVITNRGYVAGVVVQGSAGENLTPDIMGYGAAVTFTTLDRFIKGCLTTPNSDVEEIPFKVTEQGFVSTFNHLGFTKK
ncbi:MAG: serine protease [Pseudanabaena sp. CAN_BIN31]|nr:serine protease [Pseudanabaena sp. CAN_BIN31]